MLKADGRGSRTTGFFCLREGLGGEKLKINRPAFCRIRRGISRACPPEAVLGQEQYSLFYIEESLARPLGHIPGIPRQVHITTASGGDDTGWGGTFNNNWMKGLGVNDDVDSREDHQ